jgi:hypothetical protein
VKQLTGKHKLGVSYLLLILILVLIAQTLGLQFENSYRTILSASTLNSIGVNHHLGVDTNYLAYMKGAPVAIGPGSESVAGGPVTPEAFKMSAPPENPKQSFIAALLSGGKHDGPSGMGGESVGGSSAGLAVAAMQT